MNAAINFLLIFLKPVVVVFVSIVSIVAFLLGALADPQGWMNSVVITTIDAFASFLPSTPENLKIANILSEIGDSMPLVGKAIVYEVASTIGTISTISLAIKIYKLIPFKAT